MRQTGRMTDRRDARGEATRQRKSSERGRAVSRRTLLVASALLPLAARTAPAGAAGEALPVRRRADWAGGLPPRGRLSVEAPGNVRLLLVHHTATSNDYRRSDVADQLRGVYGYHTGVKGWPDVAYNFLVDRFGTVWEGRAGSLTAPVQGSATGGSQGFTQLACFLGDCSVRPPTPAARAAMLRLLAMLADRYGIDTRPGATTSFTSRGSNRWPAGVRVTTATIAGHRDMSLTSCPGDGVYADVRRQFPAQITALRRRAVPTPVRSSAGSPVAPAVSRSAAAPASRAPTEPSSRLTTAPSAPKDGSSGVELQPIGIAGAVLAAGAAAAAVLRRKGS